MARAKNTARADARRRTRAAQRSDLEAQEAGETEDATEAPAQGSRPSLFKMPNFREDIRLMPSIFRTKPLMWAPLAIIIVGLLLALVGPALPDAIAYVASLYIEFLFIPPALFTFFVAGFVAPRGSYLVGFIYGLIGGLAWAVYVIAAVTNGVVTADPSYSPLAVLATYVPYEVVYGTLAAAFAAWYRDFLRRMQDNSRKKRMDQEAKERAKRRDERQEARKIAKRPTG